MEVGDRYGGAECFVDSTKFGDKLADKEYPIHQERLNDDLRFE
jgi:hypothetical protein